MRKNLLFSLLLVVVAFTAPLHAQAPHGFTQIYHEPTKANLGGRPVVADIALFVDAEAAKRRDLQLALVTDVTKFVVETEQDLKNWVASNQNRCGERWNADTPRISFPSGMIRFALYLEYEVWNCGLRGRGEPGRFAREAGAIDVTLEPYIEEGKLQVRLSELSIDERAGVSQYLPLEFVTRNVLERELAKLNKNKKFYQAPKPLIDEGFSYVSMDAEITSDKRVVITARYQAKGNAATFDRLITAISRDGITQEQRR